MLVRTRFAPSPTGYLHIGGIRTALFSWLYARHHGGQFILRIEDTDKARSTEAATALILEGMQWLGFDYDEGPYYQSRRFDRYKAVIQQLLDNDKAYYCYCSVAKLETMRSAAMAKGEKPKYNGTCRSRKGPPLAGTTPVVRFKNPVDGIVAIDDQIQGRVSYQNSELDDLIIARADGSPTYNLTVVVDDLDMRITHVIRGDDHLNNTPRQMNIFAALGVQPPVYGHVPMILGPDRKKISKRDTNTVSVLQYREDGILPEALLNYIVRLGWSYGDQEIFSRDEMFRLFDVKDVNRAAAALNQDKLLWLNQHYLKNGDAERIADMLGETLTMAGLDLTKGPELRELALVQRERCQTLKEMAAQSRYFYTDLDSYDEAAAKKHLTPVILEAMVMLREQFAGSNEWTKAAIHSEITTTAEKFDLSMGKLAQPLRVAITGSTISPSIDDTARLLGREKTLARLDR
ncbi:MAG: glutamyl- and glutaminyl-tRNA synthetase, partial [Gammaproteobacteria bacterium]|nr:glutamyl- and glutaminyl-tRNA synthetase [Gammaproteobacteria bacterium]